MLIERADLALIGTLIESDTTSPPLGMSTYGLPSKSTVFNEDPSKALVPTWCVAGRPMVTLLIFILFGPKALDNRIRISWAANETCSVWRMVVLLNTAVDPFCGHY